MEQAVLASTEYAKNIVHYMSEENSNNRKQNIAPLTEWLTEKRNTYCEDKAWNDFLQNNLGLVKFLIHPFSLFHYPETSNFTPENMIDVIMDRALKLQPHTSPETLSETIDQDLLVLYHACFKNSK
jgi:hypothetical protein